MQQLDTRFTACSELHDLGVDVGDQGLDTLFFDFSSPSRAPGNTVPHDLRGRTIFYYGARPGRGRRAIPMAVTECTRGPPLFPGTSGPRGGGQPRQPGAGGGGPG